LEKTRAVDAVGEGGCICDQEDDAGSANPVILAAFILLAFQAVNAATLGLVAKKVLPS
jgi:hypothetical protein